MFFVAGCYKWRSGFPMNSVVLYSSSTQSCSFRSKGNSSGHTYHFSASRSLHSCRMTVLTILTVFLALKICTIDVSTDWKLEQLYMARRKAALTFVKDVWSIFDWYANWNHPSMFWFWLTYAFSFSRSRCFISSWGKFHFESLHKPFQILHPPLVYDTGNILLVHIVNKIVLKILRFHSLKEKKKAYTVLTVRLCKNRFLHYTFTLPWFFLAVVEWTEWSKAPTLEAGGQASNSLECAGFFERNFRPRSFNSCSNDTL